jgi:SAM-dependent methyltransferase
LEENKMPFGSEFSHFNTFEAETADGRLIKIKNDIFTKLAFKIMGIPHIGARLRAREILKNIKSFKERLLDAGCGTGIYSLSLNKNFKCIDAVDISKEKIGFLEDNNKYKNIVFKCCDLKSLSFPDQYFDVVICSDVLEHIKEDMKAIKEIVRVLKKGGVLLLTVPSKSKKNERIYKHYNHERVGYSLKDIETIARKLNLKILGINGYSYTFSDKISEFSYKFNNKIIIGVLFYPLFVLSAFFDILKMGEPNGLFVKLKK